MDTAEAQVLLDKPIQASCTCRVRILAANNFVSSEKEGQLDEQTVGRPQAMKTPLEGSLAEP